MSWPSIADRRSATILVRVDGAVESSRCSHCRTARDMKRCFELVRPTPQAQCQAIQLLPKSVAGTSEEMLEVSLRALETYALDGALGDERRIRRCARKKRH